MTRTDPTPPSFNLESGFAAMDEMAGLEPVPRPDRSQAPADVVVED
jgi:hypothetical protein